MKERDWEALPEHPQRSGPGGLLATRRCATRDGQLWRDVILDRAALTRAIRAAAKRSGSELLESWAERRVAAADMKDGGPLRADEEAALVCAAGPRAVRHALDAEALAQAAVEGEEICSPRFWRARPTPRRRRRSRSSFSAFERRCG
ncbi:MAG: hypothetical protein ACLU9S_21670 [Oscillospiraceae bacterium]